MMFFSMHSYLQTRTYVHTFWKLCNGPNVLGVDMMQTLTDMIHERTDLVDGVEHREKL